MLQATRTSFITSTTTFVTTFVAFYTGLIPMLATAGNTTDDGFVGAIVNDHFVDHDDENAAGPNVELAPDLIPYSTSVRLLGSVILAAGLWMVIAPQARMGLPALRWMSTSVFPGEAVAGAVVLLAGVWMALGRREVIVPVARAGS